MADSQPLGGCILCCTSIPPEKRSGLAVNASQMGAVHKLDLTSDVTHLVVGDTDTPKYKFVAKERPDVKCVLPSFIEAVRASWLEGGDTNVEELERQHKLPTFTGLRLCVTGFDDLVFRKELEDAINENGGDYRGNLTKDVTHLIAKEASGAKYNFALQWRIPTVAVEWLQQSLERGMILDESLYSLSIPPEERGQNAWSRKSMSSASLGKRAREDDIVPQNARKLRRTASARLSSQNVGLWSELVHAPLKIEEPPINPWREQKIETAKDEATPADPTSETLRFAPTAHATKPTLQKSFSDSNLGSFSGKPTQDQSLFQGKLALLHGFGEKQTAILQKALRSHGARIVEDASQLSSKLRVEDLKDRLLVVPHTLRASDVNVDLKKTWTVVTDMWIERCIFQKSQEDPSRHVSSTPFNCLPIPGFERLSICSTGFQNVDLLHASKIVKLMGGKYSEYFEAKSSVLVCNTVVPGHEKLRHAQAWSVPAVKPSWLWDSVKNGKLMPFGPYLVQPIEDPNRSTKVKEEPAQKGTIPTVKRHDSNQDSTRKSQSSNKTSKERSMDPPRNASYPTQENEDSGGFPAQSSPSPKNKTHCKTEPAISTILPDDDSSMMSDPFSGHQSSKTFTGRIASNPLQEITPNSSPPKRPDSPAKTSHLKQTKDHPPSQPQDPPPLLSEEDSLGPVISSLLAHHQNSKIIPPPATSSSQQSHPYRRRRRQLLGRAPSNLSSHGNGIELSRASSVDTMNTDGLGTPLDSSMTTTNGNATTTTKPDTNSATNKQQNPSLPPTAIKTLNPNIFTASAHHDDDPDRIEEPLQMTQLGYEDPDVAAWRERVAFKMGGGKVKEGSTPGRSKGAGAAGSSKDAGKQSNLGIAKRTRLASGGRR